jgi:hypothetical protein
VTYGQAGAVCPQCGSAAAVHSVDELAATGGAIGRRVKRSYEERVVPAVGAKQEAAMREPIAIAERHPDLRACLTDNVVFLAGGDRVVPMSSLRRGFTLEQADAVVAQLRIG